LACSVFARPDGKAFTAVTIELRINGGSHELEVEDEGEQRVVSRTTFRLVHLADILAVTSGA
jgi:hypothetical protein